MLILQMSPRHAPGVLSGIRLPTQPTSILLEYRWEDIRPWRRIVFWDENDEIVDGISRSWRRGEQGVLDVFSVDTGSGVVLVPLDRRRRVGVCIRGITGGLSG